MGKKAPDPKILVGRERAARCEVLGTYCQAVTLS